MTVLTLVDDDTSVYIHHPLPTFPSLPHPLHYNNKVSSLATVISMAPAHTRPCAAPTSLPQARVEVGGTLLCLPRDGEGEGRG